MYTEVLVPAEKLLSNESLGCKGFRPRAFDSPPSPVLTNESFPCWYHPPGSRSAAANRPLI
jgi:hypothetical protein